MAKEHGRVGRCKLVDDAENFSQVLTCGGVGVIRPFATASSMAAYFVNDGTQQNAPFSLATERSSGGIHWHPTIIPSDPTDRSKAR